MKERTMKKVLAMRQAKIDEGIRLAENKLEHVLSIEEIAAAHTAYVDMRYNALRGNGTNEAEVTAAQDAYLTALKKYGFSQNDFEYIPLCPVCGDSGNDGGKICKCIWNEYIAQLKSECSIAEKAPFTFEDCNFEKISDSAQRAHLEKFYAHMKKYAAKLPDVNTKNTVLSGGVGTGKTCLASAIARAAVERGKSCKYMSAYEFSTCMLTCHTSPIAERADRIRDVLTADLLVIDDLGTEPILKNVTVEYLLLVLEERGRAGLCTVITTNLDADGILARYKERIYSRLSDKIHSKYFTLSGNDLRHSC